MKTKGIEQLSASGAICLRSLSGLSGSFGQTTCKFARIPLSILLLLLSTASAAIGEGDYSVGGLTLGMTRKQVESKLTTKYVESKNARPSVIPSGLQVSVLINGAEDAYSLEDGNEKLIYIQHVLHFAPGKEPDRARTLSDLHAKFGAPSMEDYPRHFGWYRDIAGHTLPHAATKCKIVVSQYGEASFKELGYPGEFDEGCGLSAEVTLGLQGEMFSLVQSLALVVEDPHAVLGVIQQQSMRANNQEQDKAHNAKGKKAPL